MRNYLEESRMRTCNIKEKHRRTENRTVDGEVSWGTEVIEEHCRGCKRVEEQGKSIKVEKSIEKVEGRISMK